MLRMFCTWWTFTGKATLMYENRLRPPRASVITSSLLVGMAVVSSMRITIRTTLYIYELHTHLGFRPREIDETNKLPRGEILKDHKYELLKVRQQSVLLLTVPWTLPCT
ncbi:hypothetical protein BDV11DRAFT_189054 [Aspergillus similis]